jgi:hypothetical protein
VHPGTRRIGVSLQPLGQKSSFPNERVECLVTCFWPEREVPSVALASFNVIIALALVSVSLLLVIAVSSVAWFHDRPKELQPIRYREERRARE